MIKCSKCAATATHIPRLSMFAFTGASPVVMFFDLPLCRAHPVLDSAELITDQTWSVIVIECVAAKKLAPKRDLNKVEMIRIGGAEAKNFYRLNAIGKSLSMKVRTPGTGGTVH